ncbi:MAG TPA: fumarylacetoacetate hydrolase family protein [Ramlibacter sp.]|jgi:5-oxopent-3-ene-1,2,5-tricarboxylate decarboxylase/2-hydroxyhepta-2,4-diene-1,7-dioate isomerase|uniref:fumarylacetoacetate hydrolase family protein n=1 Tax=Ramlibacter sp. TaxID=1917967 RepID=UPI002D55AE79|nr:fumarylacetoacetate hydrolase family protein [Ramlibacter sp.]HZY17335.1 fumarylacetoacetate hydrolase family protein [Ramlibacter sp.]
MSHSPSGTVYGTLLNFRREVEALAPRMHEPPYRAPPAAPVLYVKTANTFSGDGAAIALPAHAPEVEVGATVGLVLGAGGSVRGCVLASDLSLPHASYFRPPVRFRCLDGFLGLGALVPATDPEALAIEVRIDGELRQTVRFDALVRPPARLLADVGEFMTLGDGDVLLLGNDAPLPRARVGQRIALHCAALGSLVQTLVAEAA